MKRLPLLAVLLVVVVFGTLPLRTVRAQSAATRHATVLDLTGAVGPTLNYASGAAWRLWGLDEGGRFQVGLGIRGSHYFADQNDYEGQDLANGFAGVPYALRVPKPRITALNAALHLRARVAGPLRLGFNIDLAGLSFGPERRALAAATLANVGPERPGTRPVRQNVLLGGARDRGSLNSELYAALELPRGLGLRLGYSHLVTAYESRSFVEDAGRFRRFRNLAALGLSYTLP